MVLEVLYGFLVGNSTIQLIFCVKLNSLFSLHLLVFKRKYEVPVLVYMSCVTPLKSKGIICALQEDKLTVSLSKLGKGKVIAHA